MRDDNIMAATTAALNAMRDHGCDNLSDAATALHRALAAVLAQTGDPVVRRNCTKIIVQDLPALVERFARHRRQAA